MKITIVYDNEVKYPELKADWGFSCLIEAKDTPKILFDTGATGSILLHNMTKLDIDPATINTVVISHPHHDHAGGLPAIMEANKDIELYLPQSFTGSVLSMNMTKVSEPVKICPNIFSTGELGGIEQSLVINTSKGLLVVVGCSHPGVGNILDTASRFGKVYGIVGGFHGFNEFDRLEPASLICPCHCTQYKSEIKHMFKDRCLECGAGMVIEL